MHGRESVSLSHLTCENSSNFPGLIPDRPVQAAPDTPRSQEITAAIPWQIFRHPQRERSGGI